MILAERDKQGMDQELGAALGHSTLDITTRKGPPTSPLYLDRFAALRCAALRPPRCRWRSALPVLCLSSWHGAWPPFPGVTCLPIASSPPPPPPPPPAPAAIAAAGQLLRWPAP